MSALEWGLGTGRRSIAVAPMYHGAGFAFGYAPVYTGGTVSMLRAWDPEALLAMIERDRAQSVFLVPTHAQMLRALGEDAIGARYDLSSLDTIYFNAAALPIAAEGVGPRRRSPASASTSSTARPRAASSPTCARSTRAARPGSVGHPVVTSPRSASSTTRASRWRPASPASCSAARPTS